MSSPTPDGGPVPTADGGRVRTAVAGARRRVEDARRRAPPPVLRIITRTAAGIQRVEPFDRGMTLAAQAFTSIFPLIIALAALFPDSSEDLPDRVADALGVPDSSRAVIEQALPAHPDTRGAFGILGVLIVVVSATSFSRALARMYGKVWAGHPTRLDRQLALGRHPLRRRPVHRHPAGAATGQHRHLRHRR